MKNYKLETIKQTNFELFRCLKYGLLLSVAFYLLWLCTSKLDKSNQIGAPNPVTVPSKDRNVTLEDQLHSALKCYTWPLKTSSHIKLLPDIQLDTETLKNGSNIFFHDTSCLKGLVKLTARQACSIESAAKLNPKSQIWTLFTSLVGFDQKVEHSAVIKALMEYTNIHLRNLNIWKYSEGTPAEKWVNKYDLFRSRHILEHTSDLLRFISLYKFGGTYFDTDIIVQKPFTDETQNFVGIEVGNYLGSSVLKFDKNGIGHSILDKILKEFVAKFNGIAWAENGPVLITRILIDICGQPDLVNCRILKIYDKSVFFSVPWNEWERFFDPNATIAVLNQVRNSKTVHIWNKMSAKQPVRIGQKTAYELLAQKFCPRVYEAIKGDLEF